LKQTVALLHNLLITFRSGDIVAFLLAHVRSVEEGVNLSELYEKFPGVNIKRMIEEGELIEWKAGLVRVLE
jgi:hypothetical protein